MVIGAYVQFDLDFRLLFSSFNSDRKNIAKNIVHRAVELCLSAGLDQFPTDMIFVKKFTQTDFQATSFTPQKCVICDIFLTN